MIIQRYIYINKKKGNVSLKKNNLCGNNQGTTWESIISMDS